MMSDGIGRPISSVRAPGTSDLVAEGTGAAPVPEVLNIVDAMATPEFRTDPYPFYERLRRDEPVHQGSQGAWYLTRYDDVAPALSDRRLSVDRDRMTAALAARGGTDRCRSRLTGRLGRVMTNTDPPEHTRLRRLAAEGLGGRIVEGRRASVQALVDQLLDAALASSEGLDVVADLAAPLARTMSLRLFGVPAEHLADVEAMLAAVLEPADDPEAFGRVERSLDDLEHYLGGLLTERRSRPGDDLLSSMAATASDDERPDAEVGAEVLSTAFVLFTAGIDTTRNLIGNAVVALLRHPRELERVRAEPGLLTGAVDELARYDTPSQMVLRVVAEPLTIGGQRLEEGELLYPVIAAANRDPQRFPDPDRLDLSRAGTRPLTYGPGAHFCLGAPLARLLAQVSLAALVRRLPRMRLARPEIEWGSNPVQRGPVALHVTS